jgi:hypothetical protein
MSQMRRAIRATIPPAVSGASFCAPVWARALVRWRRAIRKTAAEKIARRLDEGHAVRRYRPSRPRNRDSFRGCETRVFCCFRDFAGVRLKPCFGNEPSECPLTIALVPAEYLRELIARRTMIAMSRLHLLLMCNGATG